MISQILLVSVVVAMGISLNLARADTGTPALNVVDIEEGILRPLFGAGSDPKKPEKKIKAFKMDVTPVSVEDYSKFLKAHPEWTAKKVDSDLADKNYLKNFNRALKNPQQGITAVSWYAATAYCESKGGRLPTTLEWEYVAAADATKKSALDDPNFSDKVLRWYATPQKKPSTLDSKKGDSNYFGVKNILAMNWEWTADFNSFFLSGDNRQDGDSNQGMFCGAGALGSTNKNNYAAFLRYAMRSSLRANYAQENVGFRCAYD